MDLWVLPGNTCLAEDRAKSIADVLDQSTTDIEIESSGTVNSGTEVKSIDRNAKVTIRKKYL